MTELLNWSQVKHLKLYNLHCCITSYQKVIFTAAYAYFLRQIFPQFIKKTLLMKLCYIYIYQTNDIECITVHVRNKTYTNTHTRMIISNQFEIILVMVHINIVACECNQNMTKFLRCMEVQCGVSSKSRRCWEVRTPTHLRCTVAYECNQ